MRLTPRATALFVALALALLLSLIPTRADAIPPFARKYGVTCALCHQPIPRLTAFGEAFAGNGFEFAVGELARDTIFTGDPLLRLQRSFPLGVRVDAYQQMLSKRAAGETSLDQQVPWVIKFLSGGQVADKISYYFYFMATERGEITGLEDAYLQFTDIRGSGVSVIAGQFQVSDPLFKRELRLEYEDYQGYRVRVGDARADLTYDRGLMALWSPRKGTDLTLQFLNGQGLEAASSLKQYDRDSDKTMVLRASQDIGPLRLGVFGYLGGETASGVQNRTRMFGPDATIALGTRAELNLQALRRWDSDPFYGSCSALTPCPGGSTTPFGTSVDVGMAELVVWPGGPTARWFFTGLYNHIESDAPVVSLRLGEQASPVGFLSRYQTGSLGAHYMLRTNVRLMSEGTWDFEGERLRLVAGLTVGF